MEAQLGRYRIVSKLAQGGMAEVFVAQLDGASGFTKRYAIKQLLPELSADPELVQMLLDEARIASSLNHPNVCQIFELGESGGRHFIAMEYLEGHTLAQLARRARVEHRPLPFAVSAHIVARAAEGLAHAHEKRADDGTPLGIVHRDVSPDNIMLTREGQVKVLDFGIARAAHRSRRTRTGLVRGKVAYMSPEHIRGEDLDGRADVFALGVVLWELLAARDLFRAQDDVQAMYAVLSGGAPARPPGSKAPAALWEIAERALVRDPNQRTSSARQLAAQLDAAAEPVNTAALVAVLEQWQPLDEPAAVSAPVRAEPAPATSAEAPSVTPEPRSLPGAEPARPRTRAVEAAALPSRRWPALVAVGGVVAVTIVFAATRWLAPDAPVVVAPTPVPVAARAEVVPLEPVAPPPVEHAVAPPPEPARAKPPLAHVARVPARASRVHPAAAPTPAAPPPVVEGSGKLALDTHPWTKIYLDGRLLGDTPLDEVVVPAGHLRLRAVNAELKLDKTIEVDVIANQVSRLRREW